MLFFKYLHTYIYIYRYETVFALLLILLDHVNRDRHTKHAIIKYCTKMNIQRPLFIHKVRITNLSIHKLVHVKHENKLLFAYTIHMLDAIGEVAASLESIYSKKLIYIGILYHFYVCLNKSLTNLDQLYKHLITVVIITRILIDSYSCPNHSKVC